MAEKCRHEWSRPVKHPDFQDVELVKCRACRVVCWRQLGRWHPLTGMDKDRDDLAFEWEDERAPGEDG